MYPVYTISVIKEPKFQAQQWSHLLNPDGEGGPEPSDPGVHLPRLEQGHHRRPRLQGRQVQRDL